MVFLGVLKAVSEGSSKECLKDLFKTSVKESSKESLLEKSCEQARYAQRSNVLCIMLVHLLLCTPSGLIQKQLFTIAPSNNLHGNYDTNCACTPTKTA